MSKLKLAIVIGSIRPNRFGGHAAHWIEEVARRRGDFEVESIDLKDYPRFKRNEPSSKHRFFLGDVRAGSSRSSRRIPSPLPHSSRS
jgi:NAD(P)H-dependent FMN reductase